MYNLILMRKNHFYFFKVFFTFLLLVTHSFFINAQETTRASNTRPAPIVKTPTALRSDVFVEKVMDVGPLGVRLLRNPKTGEFWYTAFDGSVFRIKGFDTKYAKTEKVFSSDDHGISRLQGAAFYKNTLFLCGNMSANNGKGTKGRMVRYDLNRSRPVMNEVFNTVEYGTNATTYDHGWNALEISPDGKFIYVNTGARTDHGEVQDNQGAYPNARDNALTAKIYRFPIKTKNLLLVDDLTKMKAEGYIFAEGVRNAFDIAFDGSGKLFGVSNSPDYDMPEEMYWIRKGHHYGFPWVVGGIVNPQQYPDWKPNPATDPFISPGAHAWVVGYFRNDRDFPKAPAGVKFSPGIQNLGPAANEYREVSTGKIVDGDSTRVPVSTFNAHCVPMGLLFDIKKSLADDLKGDAFVFRYGGGRASSTNALLKEGRDLLHLDMSYNATADNFYTRTTRIVENFNAPVDAVIAGNKVYVLEYAGSEPGGRIWKITLPQDKKRPSKK
ncbi:MAG TPA: PQQ-dependent sugar dehydrogenase [Sphingobacteriaceae bacterium]|nr:PQQ-dependent sugar dehydrogenase [Sphingobacteriaceae bacterium]